MLPVKSDLSQALSHLCPGARRSFFCSIKNNIQMQSKKCSETTNGSSQKKKQINSDQKFTVIQCTGYLKSWAPGKAASKERSKDTDSSNLLCLVAVGRIPPNIFQPIVAPSSNNFSNLRSIQFISRHSTDGKFLFVDQK